MILNVRKEARDDGFPLRFPAGRHASSYHSSHHSFHTISPPSAEPIRKWLSTWRRISNSDDEAFSRPV